MSVARAAVRSFARREGRITAAQKRALAELGPRYAVTAKPIDRQGLFGRVAPLEVEIGFGDGAALVEMARARPAHDFIGVEVYRPGVGRLLLDLEREGLANVRVAALDAVEFAERYLEEESAHRIMAFFPDPWPKKRHHKRRLLQPGFVKLLARRLERGGELHVATDWADYAEFALRTLEQEQTLRNPHGRGSFAPRPCQRPLTKYERRGLALGHPVFDIVARRAG